MRAPVRPRRMRSSPSRRAVPGAINARLARSGSPLTPPPVKPGEVGVIGRAAEPLTPAAAPGAWRFDEASRSSGTCTFYGLVSRSTRRGSDKAPERQRRSLRVRVRGGSFGRRPGSPLHGALQVADLDNAHALGCAVALAGPASGRHEGEAEAEPGCLGQPPADRTDPADLAGEPDLADRH